MNNVSGNITQSVGTERLLGILKGTGKNYNLEKILRAYCYANTMHEG